MKKLLFAILTLLTMSACSTTAKLAEGDVLYTGVKKLDVTAADSVKIPSGISDNIGEIIEPTTHGIRPMCVRRSRLGCGSTITGRRTPRGLRDGSIESLPKNRC